MSQALQIRSQKSTETRNHGVDCTGSLEDDEKLIGTPTITATPAGLTLSNKQVTTTMKKIVGKRVPAGKAIAFSAVGVAGSYTINILCGTNSSPPEIVEGELTLIIS